MTKFEKRNAAYAQLSKVANTTNKLHYDTNGVLHLNDQPVTDNAFIEMQEKMFAQIEAMTENK